MRRCPARAMVWLAAMLLALVLSGNPARAQNPPPPPPPPGSSTSTPTPTSSPTPTATPTVTPPPGARTLLTESTNALKHVKWVHGEVRSNAISPLGRSNTKARGDCALSATFINGQLEVTKMRARMSIQSVASRPKRKTTRLNAQLIVIGSRNKGTVWVRKHKRWKAHKASGNQLFANEPLLAGICDPLLASHDTAATLNALPKSFKVESSTLQGRDVWKVSETQHLGSTVDKQAIYIDKSSLYWLLIEGHARDAKDKSADDVIVDYSRYGKAVSIKPPRA